MLFRGVAITFSAIFLTFRRLISSTSLKVWWGGGGGGGGGLKWIGTDSSVSFCMPRLCSPKRSLRMLPVCPMYCEGRVVPFFIKHHLQLIM